VPVAINKQGLGGIRDRAFYASCAEQPLPLMTVPSNKATTPA
jgi:hypothetical protein